MPKDVPVNQPRNTASNPVHRRLPRRAGVLLSAVLILGLLGLLAVRVFERPAGPLEVSLWYWHSPFRLSREEARGLQGLGVRRLFVRAGTISATGEGGVALMLPQSWQPSPGAPPVELVFVLDSGVVRHFERLDTADMARCLADVYVQQKRAAEGAGLSVGGVQLDFDCATRLLPRYTVLLKQVRHALPARTGLSITSLPTWFTSRDLRALVRQVDFYCPQFYETQIGRTLAEAKPVSDLRALKNGLAAARKLGTPFYAGLPAYGHAFMFDDHEQLLGTYRGLSASEAMRHPSFRLTRTWPADASAKPAATPAQWIGEEFADFVAIHPGLDGKGLDYHLLYSLPTAKMLAANLAAVRAHRPRNCRGVIIFRSPEPEEIMALPLPALSAALQGREPQPAVRVKVKTARSPWGMIEGRREDAALAVTVSLTNTGDAASAVADDAVTLTLQFDAPGVEAAPGDFTKIDALSPNGLRASPARASVLVCTRAHLGVEETVTLGPIQVTGAARTVWGVARADARRIRELDRED